MIKNYFLTLGLRHWLWRLMVGSLHTMPLFLVVMFAAEEGYIDNDPATRDLYFIVPSFFLWFVYLFVLPRLVPSKFAAKFAAQELKNKKNEEKREKAELTKPKKESTKPKKESTKQKQLKKEMNLFQEETQNKFQSALNSLSEFDKDGNGVIDVIEGNAFKMLLNEHQQNISKKGKTYIQNFVRMASFLKSKEENLQLMFKFLQSKEFTEESYENSMFYELDNASKAVPSTKTPNKYKDRLNWELDDFYKDIERLKDEVHTYNLLIFNSLSMIVNLIDDEMIAFYETYEVFDQLNIFKSKYETDMTEKLSKIEIGTKDISSILREANEMNVQISTSLEKLDYATEESVSQITNRLKEVNSSVQMGNRINVINAYQNYKIKRL